MTKIRKEDYHLHTDIIGCADETMRVADIVRRCSELGLEAIAITDHLNTADQLPLHAKIKAELKTLEAPLDIYFGVELNFDGPDGNFCFDEKIKQEYGFQFAIGGIHSSYGAKNITEVAEIHHQHHLKTCRNPLVDILVHPWWFWAGEFGEGKLPWPEDLSFVKERQVKELAKTALETNTAIEINAAIIFCDPPTSDKWVASYKQYLRELDSFGVTFAVGSDAHTIDKLKIIKHSWDLLGELGIPEERVWRPDCEPFVSALK